MTTVRIPAWVHSMADYRSMFDLNEQELDVPILDYPAKISCFNAEMFAAGHQQVVSADPVYGLSPMDMVKHVDLVIQDLSEQLDQYIHALQTDGERDIENLLNVWNQYAQKFLADYSVGEKEGRYVAAHLPKLPFKEQQFDLALCSDMLFHDAQFLAHDIVFELSRVAREVRIFPFLNASGDISEDLGPVMLALQNSNLGVEVKEVTYKLKKKSNAMLRIWLKECVVS